MSSWRDAVRVSRDSPGAVLSTQSSCSAPSPPAPLEIPFCRAAANEMLCDGGQIPVGNTAQLKAREHLHSKGSRKTCS